MAEFSKNKVKAMLPNDYIFIPCNIASEVEASFQTAIQAKGEMGEKGKSVFIFRLQVTLSAAVRTEI